MSLIDSEVASTLAPSGLHFVGWERGEVRLPLAPGRSADTSSAEHGRFDSERVGVDDVGMPAKVNADWWHMATEYGLFDERREFLLGIDYFEQDDVELKHAWLKVRLLDEWDLAGSGVAFLGSYFAALFTERFVPEFTMVSLDNRTMLVTTVWGNGTVNTIAVRPDQT